MSGCLFAMATSRSTVIGSRGRRGRNVGRRAERGSSWPVNSGICILPVCKDVNKYGCKYIYRYIYICMYVYIYICVCVCVNMHIYIYMHMDGYIQSYRSRF